MPFDPINRREVLGVPIGTSSSGALVGPPLDPPIETDELLFNDTDSIVITCTITNGSHTDDAVHFSNALKIGGCVAAAIGGGFVLDALLTKSGPKNKTFELEMAGVGLAGLLASALGEFLSDYGVALGLVSPDCDGPVFDSITSNKVVSLPRVNLF